ncbi:MAG: hypothetical protein HN790_02870 [Methylococcales bacterium]|jgi:hypothetical protein|nr:hypothetical protein [Methylococcales bacterium]
MNDNVRNQAVERKTALLETIKRKHQENLKCCEVAYAGTPYLEECKKAAARVMHEEMVEHLGK